MLGGGGKLFLVHFVMSDWPSKGVGFWGMITLSMLKALTAISQTYSQWLSDMVFFEGRWRSPFFSKMFRQHASNLGTCK